MNRQKSEPDCISDPFFGECPQCLGTGMRWTWHALWILPPVTLMLFFLLPFLRPWANPVLIGLGLHWSNPDNRHIGAAVISTTILACTLGLSRAWADCLSCGGRGWPGEESGPNRRHTPKDDDGPNIIDVDVPCPDCGYNLRTKRPHGTCPECGEAIENLKARMLDKRATHHEVHVLVPLLAFALIMIVGSAFVGLSAVPIVFRGMISFFLLRFGIPFSFRKHIYLGDSVPPVFGPFSYTIAACLTAAGVFCLGATVRTLASLL